MVVEGRVAVSAAAGVRAAAAETSRADPPDADPPDADPLHTGPLHTGPPRSAAPGADPAPGAAEARALIRAQLRTALGTCALVLAVLAGLPLLALVPAVAHARVHGVPLCWAVLVLGVQPVWVAVSWRQLRRAERAERAMGRR
ncbi:hypothetical protein [Actinomadura sp. GTD37]|uniref:hypothetical protein n=1 Tax=Actinomadura sp. GTD37 TaxID=1778030 RepID=UPI0035BF04F0